MTRLQKSILNLVQTSKEHLSAKDVYEIVQEKFPSVALGTVYRNLNQFADRKLIRRVTGLGSSDYYEGNIEPHNHALCISCGKVNDLNIHGLKDFIQDQIEDKAVNLDLVVNVICTKCKDKGLDLLEDDN